MRVGKLLSLTAALLLTFLMAACTSPTGTPVSPATSTPVPLAAPLYPDLDPELHIFVWSDYLDESLIAAYESTYGVDIQVDTYASNAELLARLQEGGDYDVIFPSDSMVAEMIGRNLLAPLDKSHIPNAADVFPHLKHPPYDPSGAYSVPYVWGVSGLLYHVPTFAGSPPDSWAYLFDPERLGRYRGKVNALRVQRELLGAALKYLGYSVNDTDEKHLFQARDVILQAKPFWRSMNASDYIETLVLPGRVVLSHARSRDAFIAIWQTFDASAGQATWAFAVPREGSTFWADAIAVPAASKRKRTAEHFINFLLEPKNQAANANYTSFAAPSDAATPYVAPEIRNNPAVYPPPEIQARTEWIADVGTARGLYNRIWTEATNW